VQWPGCHLGQRYGVQVEHQGGQRVHLVRPRAEVGEARLHADGNWLVGPVIQGRDIPPLQTSTLAVFLVCH